MEQQSLFLKKVTNEEFEVNVKTFCAALTV